MSNDTAVREAERWLRHALSCVLGGGDYHLLSSTIHSEQDLVVFAAEVNSFIEQAAVSLSYPIVTVSVLQSTLEIACGSLTKSAAGRPYNTVPHNKQ